MNLGIVKFKTHPTGETLGIRKFQSLWDSFQQTQGTLANNLYAYAFPATFLIPFLIEPVATIYAPWIQAPQAFWIECCTLW